VDKNITAIARSFVWKADTWKKLRDSLQSGGKIALEMMPGGEIITNRGCPKWGGGGKGRVGGPPSRARPFWELYKGGNRTRERGVGAERSFKQRNLLDIRPVGNKVGKEKEIKTEALPRGHMGKWGTTG